MLGFSGGGPAMEMHQVRYFLAVAEALNFTRAAEECHVAQPSLTRAIKQLEGELGGDLFRRERPQAQLTELGQRMLPLLRQCYDSALGARTLAAALKSGEVAALRLALSHTIDVSLFIPHIMELARHFHGLELKFLRGSAIEIAEFLKRGEAELAIAAPIAEQWERLDSWPLFTEGFDLVVGKGRRFANSETIAIVDLCDEKLLDQTYCEQAGELADLLHSRDIAIKRGHEVMSERDLFTLLEADIGIAILPRSTSVPMDLRRVRVDGLELRRTVHLYSVAGRQRTTIANAVLKSLRSYDWSKYAG
jgi:DNA-binding transcriptional LysR family regulator